MELEHIVDWDGRRLDPRLLANVMSSQMRALVSATLCSAALCVYRSWTNALSQSLERRARRWYRPAFVPYLYRGSVRDSV